MRKQSGGHAGGKVFACKAAVGRGAETGFEIGVASEGKKAGFIASAAGVFQPFDGCGGIAEQPCGKRVCRSAAGIFRRVGNNLLPQRFVPAKLSFTMVINAAKGISFCSKTTHLIANSESISVPMPVSETEPEAYLLPPANISAPFSKQFCNSAECAGLAHQRRPFASVWFFILTCAVI